MLFNIESSHRKDKLDSSSHTPFRVRDEVVVSGLCYGRYLSRATWAGVSASGDRLYAFTIYFSC